MLNSKLFAKKRIIKSGENMIRPNENINIPVMYDMLKIVSKNFLKKAM